MWNFTVHRCRDLSRQRATRTHGWRLATAGAMLATGIITVVPLANAEQQQGWQEIFSAGVAARALGNVQLSADLLASAWKTAANGGERASAAIELGASLIQANRYSEAEKPLAEAYANSSGAQRARAALDLGNLAYARKRFEEAGRYYAGAQAWGESEPEIRFGAALNSVRLANPGERLGRLAALLPGVAGIASAIPRARYLLNLGHQAQDAGPDGVELAYRSYVLAERTLPEMGNRRISAETFDALAQLYENQQRVAEAMVLTRRALDETKGLPVGAVADLLLNLEWRLARLLRASGQDDLALVAFQQAAQRAESLRQDMPIEYVDGRSSYRATLDPVFTGLADLLLKRSERVAEPDQQALLIEVRNTIELLRQADMQDYLGDRCEVEAGDAGGAEGAIPAGTAVLYPLLFEDRVELLLETDRGILRRKVAVPGAAVRKAASAMAEELRRYWSSNYLREAQQLYDWLLRPLLDAFDAAKTETLVVVPDGTLRLIPFGALHDGRQFAVQSLAITTVTGMSMTSQGAHSAKRIVALLAGLSQPGPVVDKLGPDIIGRILGGAVRESAAPRDLKIARATRSLRQPSAGALPPGALPEDSQERMRRVMESLALPGVKQEILALQRSLPNRIMLDSGFTLGSFQKEAQSGDYRILHIASHGVFGGSANDSYVLAFDDLLTMNGLESLLKAERFRTAPIELLTLSACETAEGDERSPLGIAGVAIKARARSVIGTLWPVDDEAARLTMEKFYSGLVQEHLTKAEALRRAQLELIRNQERSHPFFWAPFLLVGNWL